MRDRFYKLDIVLLLAFFVAGCHQENKIFREIKEDGIVIQVNEIDNHGDTNSRHYTARILLSGAEFENNQQQMQHSMWYEADSSFYLTDGATKTYPKILQPVSNGVKNSFEYLIVFDKYASTLEMSLVYDNKLLRPKTYSFKPEQN